MFSKNILNFVLIFQLCNFYKAQCCQGSGSAEARAKFLSRFVETQATSNKIVMYFCQNREYIIDFSRIMLKEFYSLTVIKSTEDLQTFDSRKMHTFVLDGECDNSLEILIKGYYYNLFGESNNWILFNHNSSLASDLHLEINSRFFEVKVVEDVFDVKAIFKYSPNDRNLSSNDITKWTAKSGFTYLNTLSSPGTRINLLGTPLKVSYQYNRVESLSHLTDYRELGKDNGLKFMYILLDILADYLNATHEAAFTKNFGYSFDNKSQMFENNSMLGDVQKGIADVVGSYLWVETNRLLSFDFIALSVSQPTEFVFRAPTIPVVENVFLLPFNSTAWYCIIFCLFFGTVLLYIILVQEKRISMIREDSSVVDIMMSLLSALLQKSWNFEFNTYSGKFALAVIYLCFMVIYTAYTASIIVFLRGTSESLKSFKDLYNTDIDIGVNNMPYNFYYYLVPNRRANEYWRNKIYKEKILNKSAKNFFMPAEEGIKKMHKEYFAFQCQVSTASYFIEKMFLPYEKCNLRYAPTIYSVSDLYLPIRKNCSYTNHYRVGVAKILEHGLLRRSFLRLFTRKPVCHGNPDNFSGIGLKETRFIFMFCCGAFVACLFCLIVEIVISRFERKHLYVFVN